MANVLTAKKIKELVNTYNLGKLYVVIEHGVHGTYDKRNKDKLAASVHYKNTSVDLTQEIYGELFDPLRESIEKSIEGNGHRSAAKFTRRGPRDSRVYSIGFMAKGWPKLKQLLTALGIKYKIYLGLIENKEHDLTLEGQKILGFKDLSDILTSKKIKELVKKYKLGKVYVVIESGVHGAYDKRNKDKLAASVFYKNTSVRLTEEIRGELFDPLCESIRNSIKGNEHRGTSDFTMLRGRVDSIGFMAKGWRKLQQLLTYLKVKYEFDSELEEESENYLTPKGQDILGI